MVRETVSSEKFQTRACCLRGSQDYAMAPHTHVDFPDGGAAAIFICQGCGMTPFFSTYDSRYRELLSEDYYADGYYTFKGSPRKTAWLKTFLDEVEQEVPLTGKSLLDMGCGEGLLLDAGRERGANVKGIEPEAAVVAELNARGLAGFAGLLEDYVAEPGESWDVITMFLVIDAMIDPVGALKKLRGMVSDDGVLAILTGSRYKTPFFTKPAFGYGGVVPRIVRDPLVKFRPEADWADYHPYFFTRKTLLAILKVAGFETVYCTSEQIGGTRLVARPTEPVPLTQVETEDPGELAKDFENWHRFDRTVRPVYKTLVEKPVMLAARAIGRGGNR